MNLRQDDQLMTTSSPLITTDRLTLRYFDETKEKSIFFEYRNDKDNNKYQGWPHPFTKKHLDDFFISMKDRDITIIGEWIQIALVENDSGILIGDCACNNDGQNVEIGITIRREYQRMGFAKEALIALFDILFNQIKVHRIVALLDVDNIGSKMLMESLGMRQEGHHIKSYWDEKMNEWRDEYYYALLAEENND